MKSIQYIILFLCFPVFMSAQNVEFELDNFPSKKKELKDVIAQIEEGDNFYIQGKSGMYIEALKFYLPANQFNPNNAVLNYKIGKSYLNSIEKTKSIPFLEKAIKLDSQIKIIKTDVYFMLAKAYQLNTDFEKAIAEYERYKTLLVQNEKYLLKEINKHIEECKAGKDLMLDPARAFIDPLPMLNTQFAEYSPIVNADNSVMFFTARKPENVGGKIDPSDLGYYEDVYYTYSSNLDINKWETPKNPGRPINNDEHDAIVGLSPDGQKLFLYKGDNGGDIYECTLKGNSWSKPARMDYPINTEFHEPSASFSYDGRTVYFVSNRDGGMGMHDIYVVKRNADGTWGEAKNLGKTINTEYDEKSIFMLSDGRTLFFSSNGHNTMGGYDIFRTNLNDDGTWEKPINISYPISSPYDDIFFTIDASGKHGYYSTIKSDGKGDQDIYKITFIGPEKQIVMNTEYNLLASLADPVGENILEAAVNITASPVTILKGKVFDETTKTPLEASIELYDNEKNEILAVFTSNSLTGNYLVSLPAGKNYGISIKAEQYLFHSENFLIPKSSVYSEVVKDIGLKKVSVGTKIVLRNIFFDVGKATLRAESYAELGILRKTLTDNPNLKIEISGHTDNTGSEATNKSLSEKRAKAVVDYLIAQGIDTGRLQFAGYGESQPIADNNSADGRQLNRRTEFKVLSNE